MLQLIWTLVLLFVLPGVAGMTGIYHQTQLLLVEIGSHELFAKTGLELVILPISAS
jgi:hypothetical protein